MRHFVCFQSKEDIRSQIGDLVNPILFPKKRVAGKKKTIDCYYREIKTFAQSEL
jgi:hypothetical protein